MLENSKNLEIINKINTQVDEKLILDIKDKNYINNNNKIYK